MDQVCLDRDAPVFFSSVIFKTNGFDLTRIKTILLGTLSGRNDADD